MIWEGTHSLAAGLLAVSTLVGAPTAAHAAGDPADPDPLVAGQGIVRTSTDPGRPGHVITVHAVRRVPHGTLVYLSSAQERGIDHSAFLFPPWAVDNLNGVSGLCQVMVVDTAGGRTYEPLPAAPPMGSLACLASPSGDPQAGEGRLDTVAVVVLPELPERLREVDVVASGVVAQRVPVSEGALTPVSQEGYVGLESPGWPAVGQDVIDKVARASRRTGRPLELTVESLDGAESASVAGPTTRVQVRSDILFAVDRYELTPPARARIGEIAREMVAAGDLSKPVRVTGHTDNVGTGGHNRRLSEQRAQSVAAELRRHLPAGTVVQASGKSFSQPVASNATPQGRAQNRRVEIEVSKK